MIFSWWERVLLQNTVKHLYRYFQAGHTNPLCIRMRRLFGAYSNRHCFQIEFVEWAFIQICQIVAVASCSTHKIDQQETDG